MNWLAHLHLAAAHPLERLGNLAGDFVRGIDLVELDPAVRRGVEHHRALDRFTDAHPAHRAGRRRITGPLGRASGVLVDVFFDHFLARDWDRWHPDETLAAFATRVEAELELHAQAMPPALRDRGTGFTLRTWLIAYADLDGIADVLRRMERRIAGRVRLSAGTAWLREHHAAFAADFAAFWPEAEAFARQRWPRPDPAGAGEKKARP